MEAPIPCTEQPKLASRLKKNTPAIQHSILHALPTEWEYMETAVAQAAEAKTSAEAAQTAAKAGSNANGMGYQIQTAAWAGWGLCLVVSLHFWCFAFCLCY